MASALLLCRGLCPPMWSRIPQVAGSVCHIHALSAGKLQPIYCCVRQQCIRIRTIPHRSHSYQTQWRSTMKPLGQGFGYKLMTFMFVSPISFLRTRFNPDTSAHEAEAYALIPKEVFKKDVLIKRKKKHSFLRRVFNWFWLRIRFLARVLRVLLTFGPLISVYPIVQLNERLQFLWWRVLLRACEFSGPTFIKLGQWASTRRDLFPDAFCDMFARLHDSTRRHSWYSTQAKLRKAFGPNWKKVFLRIQKKPVGSGCIAQVWYNVVTGNVLALTKLFKHHCSSKYPQQTL